MAKYCYLIVPTDGLFEAYDGFESLFEFWPGGVKSVIQDYFDYHAVFDQRRVCSSGVEDDVLERVIEAYEKSVDYRNKFLDYPNCQEEFTIEVVCAGISNRVKQIVYDHEEYFRELYFAPEDLIRSGNNAILTMSKSLLAQ